MGLAGGGFLRLFQTFLYALAFCCSGIILGLFSYFLAVLSDRKEVIAPKWKAVEGISGIAVLYTIFAIVLTCCLGGVSFFGFVAIVLNILFIGGFAAIAILTRDGAKSCTASTVYTPLGSGAPNSGSGFGQGGFGEGSGDQNTTYASTLKTACRFNKVCFAVAIIGAFLFLILALVQVLLVRHHKKEKRYGPSPANNYTSGSSKRKFWQRKNKKAAAGTAGGAYGAREAEMGAVDTRPSHDTGYTGSTVAGGAPQTGYVKDAEPLPNHNHNHGHSTHGRYYTQPEGTGVNPYGYENGHTGAPAPARNF